MPYRTIRLCFALLAGCIVLGHASAIGQEKSDPRINPRLFLLYALEDMTRRVPQETGGLQVVDFSPQVMARFLANRRLLFDLLRRHIEEKKLEDILPAYRAYEKELILLDEFKENFNQASEIIYMKLHIVRTTAANNAASAGLVGLTYGLLSVADGDDVGALRGMALLFSAQRERAEKEKVANLQAFRDIETVYNTTAKEFRPRLEESQKQHQKLFQETAKALVEANQWSDAEFAYERRGGSAVRNPFLLAEQARKILKKKDATVEELLQQARVCAAAAKSVPLDPVFNTFRASFFMQAGILANRAAALEIGKTGFPMKAKEIPRAGRVARDMWQLYLKYEPFGRNVNERVIQEYLLSCAYAGAAPAAYQVIEANVVTVVQRGFRRSLALRGDVSNRPEFWYDCARICSVTGNLGLSLECLTRAKQLGFRDVENAKVDQDLRNVQGSPQFKQLFP